MNEIDVRPSLLLCHNCDDIGDLTCAFIEAWSLKSGEHSNTTGKSIVLELCKRPMLMQRNERSFKNIIQMYCVAELFCCLSCLLTDLFHIVMAFSGLLLLSLSSLVTVVSR